MTDDGEAAREAASPERRKRIRRRGTPPRARVLVLWGAGALLAWLLLVWVPLPSIVVLRFRDPSSTAFIDARRERLRGEGRDDRIDRRPVPLERVSPNLVRAVLAAEDARFFTHHGIDWDAVRKARERNRRFPRRAPLGASTITQQLAKNLYLSPERSLLRKAREAAIALALEALLGKRRILELYLSAIEWGDRVYGCEAAARRTFGVPAAALSPSQAAWLAAMIPAPRLYLANPARHARRAERIERRAARPVPPSEPLDAADDETPR